MDYISELHEMCDTITTELADANEKIRSAGGKLTAGDVDYIDKLTHTLKSIKGVVAMEEAGDDYSNRAYPMGGIYRGGSYRDGMGGSYARGRGSNARRDSMGRYSSRGYSRDGGMADELRELMEDAPNDTVRRDIQRLIDKMEQQ